MHGNATLIAWRGGGDVGYVYLGWLRLRATSSFHIAVLSASHTSDAASHMRHSRCSGMRGHGPAQTPLMAMMKSVLTPRKRLVHASFTSCSRLVYISPLVFEVDGRAVLFEPATCDV